MPVPECYLLLRRLSPRSRTAHDLPKAGPLVHFVPDYVAKQLMDILSEPYTVDASDIISRLIRCLLEDPSYVARKPTELHREFSITPVLLAFAMPMDFNFHHKAPSAIAFHLAPRSFSRAQEILAYFLHTISLSLTPQTIIGIAYMVQHHGIFGILLCTSPLPSLLQKLCVSDKPSRAYKQMPVLQWHRQCVPMTENVLQLTQKLYHKPSRGHLMVSSFVMYVSLIQTYHSTTMRTLTIFFRDLYRRLLDFLRLSPQSLPHTERTQCIIERQKRGTCHVYCTRPLDDKPMILYNEKLLSFQNPNISLTMIENQNSLTSIKDISDDDEDTDDEGPPPLEEPF